MAIGINNIATSGSLKTEKVTQKKEAEKKTQDVKLKNNTDTVKIDMNKINELKAEAERQQAEFKDFIQRMVSDQAGKSNLTLFGKKLNVSVEDSQKAAAVADGGEYSVNSVATRILSMAEALSGGDPAKLKELRAAVEEGFKQAGAAFGQEMPQITKDTYNEVMRRFDEWEKTGTLNNSMAVASAKK